MTMTQIVPMAGVAINTSHLCTNYFNLDLTPSPKNAPPIADEIASLERRHLSEYESWDDVRKTL